MSDLAPGTALGQFDWQRELGRYVCPYEVATEYVAMGDYAEALRWLEQAVAERANCVPWLLADPRLDSVRESSQFQALLRHVGFPGYTEDIAEDIERAPIERIAVLPFANISRDKEQECFVDGMTEALTMELARIKALTVVSRTSAMQYKNVLRPMSEIARELGLMHWSRALRFARGTAFGLLHSSSMDARTNTFGPCARDPFSSFTGLCGYRADRRGSKDFGRVVEPA